MTIDTLEQANRALLPYVPLVGQLKAGDVTLKRVRPLMKLLGNPEDKLRIVHIAGTSGKTSTAYFIAALLRAGGQKVGLTVSPHVDTVAERVQINNQLLPEAEFCGLLDEFLEIIQAAQQPPTYFELLYAFALWVFARQGVDYAVVETGMGGLHDATNVARRPDKICVITDIGFDHTHLLGKTLPDIITQKVGIVHRHNHVFMYEQAPEIMKVVARHVKDQEAALHIVSDTPPDVETPAMAEYQQRNWKLAYTVYDYLIERDGLHHLTERALQKTQRQQIPARMEVRQLKGKILIMDGAHNAQKMFAFVSSFRQLYPGVRPAILIGLKDGKEYQELLPLLIPLASRIITTAFETTQDLPVKSMSPSALAAAFEVAGAREVQSIAEPRPALQALLDGSESICIITGSFYLISQIRNNEPSL